jgi:predicted ATPase/DNA-binding SARP family transcriptional activator
MTGGEAAGTSAGSGTLRIAVLGGFSVRAGNGAVAGGWRLRKAKTLVKLLAVADRHRAHRDLLTDVLWPDLDQVAATNNLHQALHAARRVLAATGLPPAGVLCLRDDLVILAPATDLVVDADLFAAAAQRGLSSRAVEDFQAALDLYAGELLPEDRDAEWAESRRQRLTMLHDASVTGLARALAERGDTEEAVTLLRPLAAARPGDEPLHRALIDALDRAGQRWDALDAYERLRRVLEEEYAAGPEVATRSLYRRILAGQSASGPAVASNLPPAATSFIGRRREIAELLALTGRTRALTLTGPGGVGKTRLAIEAVRQLANAGSAPDGAWLVDLAGLREGRHVPAAAAASLGVPLTGARPATEALVRQLADRALIMLLDNCEHLLESCADLVAAVLAGCPDVRVVATSREPLRLPGEVVWRVPSLQLPDLEPGGDPGKAPSEAVQLFLERAQAAAPAVRLDPSAAGPVTRICRRLDGIPLALELAAARTAHLAPAELANRLDDALGTLAVRIHGVPDRQATLAAALTWSHDLLTGTERAVFRRLAVFAGGFTLGAAEPVCADGLPEPVAAVISRLVDKSLVAADTTGDTARFRLLEVVRQYAAGQLESSGEMAAHRHAHAVWHASRAQALDPDEYGGQVGEPSPWFSEESENLRVALSTLLREEPDWALATAVAAWRSWMARGLHAEGLRWLTQALDAAQGPAPSRGRALFATAVLEVRLGRLWRAAAIGAQIAALGQQSGDAHARAEALHQHALLTWVAGEWAQADRVAAQATAAAAGIASVTAAHDHLRAVLALSRGDPVAAAALLESSLAALGQVPADAPPFFPVCALGWSGSGAAGLPVSVFEETMLVGRRVGAGQGRGYILTTQALAERMADRADHAAVLLDRALRLFESMADRAGEAHVLMQRGHLLRERGDAAGARQCFRSAADVRASIPDQRGTAIALSGVALAEAGLRDFHQARALGQEACRMLERSGDLPGYVGALSNLGVAEVLAGRPAEAIEAVERALALRAVPDTHRSVGWQHAFVAALHSNAGHAAAAADLLTAARACFEQIGDRRGLAAIDARRTADARPRPAR